MGTPIKKMSKQIFKALTTAVGAYSSGQVIGGLQELPDFFESFSGVSEIVDCEIFDPAKQDAKIAVVIFSSKPSGTFADSTTFAPSAADLALIDGVVPVAATAYTDFSANSVATVTNVRNKVGATVATVQNGSNSKAKSAWMVVLCLGTPTYGVTSGFAVQFGIEQDV